MERNCNDMLMVDTRLDWRRILRLATPTFFTSTTSVSLSSGRPHLKVTHYTQV
jgi:hypothetical protein